MVLKNKNEKEWALITEIANSGNDRPVLMLNLNRYTKEADFPNGKLYQDYMSVLADFLPVVGGEILWRRPALGHPVGDVEIHEVLAAWYPTH